jgi:hypothetical protein
MRVLFSFHASIMGRATSGTEYGSLMEIEMGLELEFGSLVLCELQV